MNQFLRWFSVQTASETGNNFLSWCFDPGFENGGKVVRLTSKTDGHYDVYHPIICTPMTKPGICSTAKNVSEYELKMLRY